MKMTLVIFTTLLLLVVSVSDSFAKPGKQAVNKQGNGVTASDQTGKYELGPKVVTNKSRNS